MYLSRLFRALSLSLDEPLSIECDDRQSIRLLRGPIQLSWQETKKMMADGLTKTLNKALFQRFRDMTGLEDQVERREYELKDQLIQSSDNEKSLGDNIINN